MNRSAPIPADQRVRDRIRDDLDATLVIEAAAGTGKTTALVNRIVSAIGTGRAALSQIVAVTFTEKAAGELKLRLRSAVETARQAAQEDPAWRGRLRQALEQLEEARIGTIHSFCAELLRERPVEAGVDPRFEVASEDVARGLFDDAFERWFEGMLAGPGPGMRRILCRGESGGQGPRGLARQAAFELAQWRDFAAPWAQRDFDRNPEIDRLVTQAAELGELARAAPPEDYLARALLDFGRVIGEAARLETVRARDYDALEATLLSLLRGWKGRWEWRGFGERFGEGERAAAIERRARFRRELEEFADRCGANLAPLLREELWPAVEGYGDLKRRAGVLDFLDLLLTARDLVRDNAAARAQLQRRFTHIFIDEFQDTDPLQVEILMLLASDDPDESDWTRTRPIPGKLFIVGDPKQSIYRFRRADVALYQNVKHRLVERGAEVEHLTTSFRATSALQELVNAAFAPAMERESATQPGYAALKPFRMDCDAQPAIVVLPVPAPYGQYGRMTARAIEESLPEAAAAMVRWMVAESGWTVTERENPERRVPLDERHICILFRRLNSHGNDVARPYLRALEARQVSHVLIKGGSFSEREEVEALRNALGAIERPDDELAVFATLRGPLFAFSDGALLRWRETLGGLHPFRRFGEGLAPPLQEVADALGLLRELNRGRNRRPIAETIARLLAATRAHGAIAIWPSGEQALGNLMRVSEMARRYEERGGATSFRGFVEELEERSAREEASDAPVVEEGTGGVRIMTVHRAKGLEFPVVLLADITCNESAAQAYRFVDPGRGLCALRLAGCAPTELLDHADEELRREREEAARVLYVAATRARDLLIVPAVGDQPYPGWLSLLNPALYPAAQARRAPLSKAPPGCPEMGEDSVIERPPKAPTRARAVAPGLHRAEAGAVETVWWDPARLSLNAAATMGLRQQRLLEADRAPAAAEHGAQLSHEWSARREALLEAGRIPSLRTATATEMARVRPPSGGASIEAEEAVRVPGRPHGRRFGTLVHATILRVALDGSAGEIEAVAALEGRILGADAAEIAAAAVAVKAALATPMMRRARAAEAAGGCRRECPLSIRGEDGMIVEGVADVAFVEDTDGGPRWTVVDFKTDLDLEGRLEEYRAQLEFYLRAVTASTGAPARGVLLWI